MDEMTVPMENETTKKSGKKEKTVKVTLPIINENDMVQYVAVNGRSFQIRRGEEVEVPVTWVCVSDNLGGNTYVPKHSDVSAVYTFEAQLGDGYKIAGNLPEDYVMPFVTVSYTQDAQELNSQAPEMDTEINAAVDTASGMSVWSWIIWIIVIVIIVVVLWWLFAGSKNNKEK